jgi:hypothetical protein
MLVHEEQDVAQPDQRSLNSIGIYGSFPAQLTQNRQCGKNR